MSDFRFHTSPVRDARHALEMLDDVNSLVNFCSVSMPDGDRYYRGSEAMWRVSHWIADTDRAAIAALVATLSMPQRGLLRRMTPFFAPDQNPLRFSYAVKSHGVGLQSCLAMKKRGLVEGGEAHAYERAMVGYLILTPLGARVRDALLAKAASE